VPVDAAAIKERVDLLELIGRDTRLRKVASTRGGEYAGPLPLLWRARPLPGAARPSALVVPRL
jgi:hypothetical protein